MAGTSRRTIGRVFGAALLSAPLAACVGTALQIVGPGPQPLQRYSMSSDVLFDFGSATLRPEASAALQNILGQIRAVYPYPAIRVEGHTDSIGTDAANDVLSERRAQSVQRWLVNAGIPAAAVTTQGFGKRQPIAPNSLPNGADNPAGRQQNRRVVLAASPA